jgi:hypothetical protein
MDMPPARSALGLFFIAVAVVASAFIWSGTWKRTHPTGDYEISVTGLASENFESDLIVWSGNFSQFDPMMKSAYERIKQNAAAVREYLMSKGIPENEFVFSSVDIERTFKPRYNEKGNQIGSDFTGYRLTQSVKIESHDVSKVEGVSREVTELIDKGVEFNSSRPSYFYTKLADLKIKMLAAATTDARTRAEQVVQNAHATLGALKDASMGIFQITAQNSDEEFSSGGAYNTVSKWKTASITVHLRFTIE